MERGQKKKKQDEETTVCTVVGADYASDFCYRVCSLCERPLSHSSPHCAVCNPPNSFNPRSSGSKRLFRLLLSVASDTKIFRVICFDRAARVLFGCSADDFFHFAKLHPFTAATAAQMLEGEIFKMTLVKSRNGNAQHMRVASIVPLRSGYRPLMDSLRQFYGANALNAPVTGAGSAHLP